jgi:uncharacterized membrane protein YkvA (DUF1232 family)
MFSLSNWRRTVRRLKTETYALYLAYKDPRVPWYARVFVAVVVAYAFSPLDLIPDFIPILGYLDDLVLLPLGIFLAVKMIPPPVLKECRRQARTAMAEGKPVNRGAAVVIVLVWLGLAVLAVVLTVRLLG